MSAEIRSTFNESADFAEMLHGLSEASVHRSFDPYVDIDWEAKEFAFRPDDPRWILPEIDPLGRHPWYKALPLERQITIGTYRQTEVVKVGLQFEQALIAGLIFFAADLPNGSAAARYATHEVIEECNHTLMFQEVVNRTGLDVPGMAPAIKALGRFAPLVVRLSPALFFMMVLAGEEPIDHLQKSFLRSDADYHPMIESVMRIHIAEEARHISFAHEFLRQNLAGKPALPKFMLSLAFPIIQRAMAQLIAVPPATFWSEFGIPRSVRRDLFWKLPDSRATLQDLFGDVRMLAEETGMMNPVSRRIWGRLGIGGRPSRFRGEPSRG